jgi:hypothetical protein
MFSVNNKFKIYPNPANESVYILAQENVTDVWLVSAKPKKIHQDVNFSSILNTDLYSEQSIITNSIVSLATNSKQFHNEHRDSCKDIIKYSLKSTEKTYWDNLYKYEIKVIMKSNLTN